METPSAFEQVGHVAHVNLREEFLPYKYTIAKIIADKNPRIRTVVNKVGVIDSMFRVPNWELLYGEPDLKATVKQHGYSFEVDFGKVYWNSRLETEHKRLVDVAFKRGEVIVDAMAGVGPFVVPAVKTKGCRVYASDLNPDCFEMMQKNVKLNKMEDSVKLYNLDARAFIKSLLTPVRKNNGPEETWMQNISAYEEELKKFREKTANEGNDEKETDTKKIEKKRKRLEEKSVPKPKWSTTLIAGEDANTPPSGATFDHIIMNLPATAVEFLDCLKHSFDRATWSNRKLPTVHAYAFRPPGHTDQDVISRAEGHLGCPIKNAKVHEVRDVAPNKAMVCVSFQITEEQAFAP
jgi:tRNA (guanine37-N1)-methyltransferase